MQRKSPAALVVRLCNCTLLHGICSLTTCGPGLEVRLRQLRFRFGHLPRKCILHRRLDGIRPDGRVEYPPVRGRHAGNGSNLGCGPRGLDTRFVHRKRLIGRKGDSDTRGDIQWLFRNISTADQRCHCGCGLGDSHFIHDQYGCNEAVRRYSYRDGQRSSHVDSVRNRMQRNCVRNYHSGGAIHGPVCGAVSTQCDRKSYKRAGPNRIRFGQCADCRDLLHRTGLWWWERS